MCIFTDNMKSKEEKIIEHLSRTSFSGIEDKYKNKAKSGYTNGWGLILIPLVIFIGIIYFVFKVLS